MAVMASPPSLDQAAFGTSTESKAQPTLSSQDAMAIDVPLNGTAPPASDLSMHDPLFDDHPAATTNGAATVDAPEEPHTNGTHSTTDPDVTKPITDVTSGIAPTAPFLQETPTIADPAPSIPAAVEQPVSDVRDEPASLPTATESSEDHTLASVEDNTQPTTQDTMEVDESAQPIDVKPTDASNGIDSTVAPTDAPLSGQVRPREEDGEDVAPSAKRTKTEDSDTIAVKPNPITNGNGVMAPPLQIPAAPSQPPKSFGTDPATDIQLKFLAEKLRQAKKIKAALAFLNPVDHVALGIPSYPEIIKEPMDISTMERKLKDNEYVTVDSLVGDFELMVQNSVTFNGVHHPVTDQAQNLKAYFYKLLEKLPKGEAAIHQEKKPKKPPVAKPAAPSKRESRQSTGGGGATSGSAVIARSPATAISPQNTFALSPDGVPLIRRDSTTNDGRPKREIHRPPPRDLPYATAKPKRKKFQMELKFATSVVEQLLDKSHVDYSYPFLQPVDPVALNIPTYHNIIKKPMDMSTVNRNLKNGAYNNAKEVHADVKLMFANCYKFNPPADAVNQMGKRYEKIFDTLWAQKDDWIAREETGSGPGSASGSDAEGESEEEVEDPDEARLKAIQAQVAALNSELARMKGKKSTSPKLGNKKAPKPKAPKAKKPTITLPPLAKNSQKKAPKIPQVSLNQKRQISEGISVMSQEYMEQALTIIRRGYPQAVGDSEEIELDVEELPNDVLWDLLKLVKQASKAAGSRAGAKEEEPVDEDYEPPIERSRATATSAKPRKNKPMNAREQEAKIAALSAQLGKFQNGSGSDDAGHNPNIDTSDDDDDDESESEEE